MKSMLCAGALLVAATSVQADLMVRFDEGAPKDRFVLTNGSGCDLGAVEVEFDLTGSAAGLIFDTTGAGAGVEVFQPFELVAGGDYLIDLPSVTDGDRALSLRLNSLPPQASVAFTIDVDDTTGGQEIIVNNSEITGAAVKVRSTGGEASGTFDRSASARVDLATCLS